MRYVELLKQEIHITQERFSLEKRLLVLELERIYHKDSEEIGQFGGGYIANITEEVAGLRMMCTVLREERVNLEKQVDFLRAQACGLGPFGR
jgi:hypothetical protein